MIGKNYYLEHEYYNYNNFIYFIEFFNYIKW